MNIPATPTPIPIDNMPEPFRSYVFGMFKDIIAGFKECIIPFTHVSLWDYVVFCIVLAAAIKAIKLMYGKGDASKHE